MPLRPGQVCPKPGLPCLFSKFSKIHLDSYPKTWTIQAGPGRLAALLMIEVLTNINVQTTHNSILKNIIGLDISDALFFVRQTTLTIASGKNLMCIMYLSWLI